MTIIVNGAAGRMGREMIAALRKDGTFDTVGVDKNASGVILPALDCYRGEACALVDFSHHTAIGGVLDYAVCRAIPAVICTTGFSAEERASIAAAAEQTPVFISANMSVGIAAFISTVKTLVGLFPEAEVEIVEAHHSAKADAPSGTALMIARAVQSLRPESVLRCGRQGEARRENREIGIHSLRYGRVPGEHTVIIATPTQTFTLRHSAASPALFAEGALAAARFLIGRATGLYTMEDLVAEQLKQREAAV